MKCILCDQRKAKRSCPAKDTQICPQCCGEKRVLEIDCPESCRYLKEGREWEAAEYRKRVQNLDQATQDRNRRVILDYQNVIAHLEYAISHQRIVSRNLKDKEVTEAADILLENYRTEDKGLLYEKTSDNLRVESLRRELRDIIESYRNPEGEKDKGIVDPKNQRLQLGAAIECLEFIRSLALAYMEDRGSSSGYVDFLARVVPREEKSSSIIMP
jgi:hypothetical protein